MVFGTFDGLHPGHLFFLQSARALGDELFVIVARDENVKKIKGQPPCHPQADRIKAIEETGLATHVEAGHPIDFYQCLRTHLPTVVALGYDQKANETKISEILPQASIERIDAFKPERYKSSLLRE